MNDATLCLFPWDLQDEGLEQVLQFAVDSGLTSLFLASVYHSGWFVRPHNPKQKCYMADYLAVLDDQVASLADEIKADVRQSGVLLEGVEEVDAYDVRLVGAYGQPPIAVADLTWAARQQCVPHQKIRVGFRLGFDSPKQPGAISSAKEARDCVQAAAENEADSVFFYNYSESPKNYLNWIKPAMDGMIHPTISR